MTTKRKTVKRGALIAARGAKGLSQEEAAALAGMSRAHLGLVETGVSGLSAEKAMRLAAVLDVDVATVLRVGEVEE